MRHVEPSPRAHSSYSRLHLTSIYQQLVSVRETRHERVR